MKCGHCKGSHETVAEVRKCSEGEARPANSGLSANQQGYLGDLLAEFSAELPDGNTPATIGYQAGQPLLTALIDARRAKATGASYSLPSVLVLRPNAHRGKSKERTSSRPPYPNVPEGHYAVPSRTGNNDLDFWRVDRPTEGQWAGRTFVKRIIGGRPDSSVRGGEAVAALKAILAYGIDEARFLYGQETEQCWKCNRQLTEQASRELSIGPVCAEDEGQGAEWQELNSKYKAAERRKAKR